MPEDVVTARPEKMSTLICIVLSLIGIGALGVLCLWRMLTFVMRLGMDMR
jgi:hypothetical protein